VVAHEVHIKRKRWRLLNQNNKSRCKRRSLCCSGCLIICGVWLKICSYAATDCGRRVMDLVFVVATSDSMQDVFNSVRSFIATLVQPMNIGVGVRVGIVTWVDRDPTPCMNLRTRSSISNDAIIDSVHLDHCTAFMLQYVINGWLTDVLLARH